MAEAPTARCAYANSRASPGDRGPDRGFRQGASRVARTKRTIRFECPRMKYYGLDWIGTVLGLLSIYYLGRKRKIGFIFRIVAAIFWVAFGVVAGTTAGILANVAVILLSIN